MDLGDLIILLFFVLPVISRLLGARKKPRQIEEGAEGSGESAFERAIREIERALDESQHEERTSRLPQPERHDGESGRQHPTPRRAQHQRRDGARKRSVDSHEPFHDVAPGSFESKQYEEFTDSSSERFDSADYREFRELTPAKIDESLFEALVPDKETVQKSKGRLRSKLRGKQTVREAYAIAELLGPPRALKKRSGPRHP